MRSKLLDFGCKRVRSLLLFKLDLVMVEPTNSAIYSVTICFSFGFGKTRGFEILCDNHSFYVPRIMIHELGFQTFILGCNKAYCVMMCY